MTILPTGCPSTVMSKNTFGLAIAAGTRSHVRRLDDEEEQRRIVGTAERGMDATSTVTVHCDRVECVSVWDWTCARDPEIVGRRRYAAAALSIVRSGGGSLDDDTSDCIQLLSITRARAFSVAASAGGRACRRFYRRAAGAHTSIGGGKSISRPGDARATHRRHHCVSASVNMAAAAVQRRHFENRSVPAAEVNSKNSKFPADAFRRRTRPHSEAQFTVCFTYISIGTCTVIRVYRIVLAKSKSKTNIIDFEY